MIAVVPWCDSCDEYRAPSALTVDGQCATCDSEVDVADLAVPAPTKAPWHFKLMVAALVLYLGWRLIEGFAWIAARF